MSPTATPVAVLTLVKGEVIARQHVEEVGAVLGFAVEVGLVLQAGVQDDAGDTAQQDFFGACPRGEPECGPLAHLLVQRGLITISFLSIRRIMRCSW